MARKALNSRKKGRGGGLIGKGTYGCVYRPAKRCNGNTTRRKNTLTKYMTKNNAYQEYTKRYFLKRLDPAQEWILYPQDFCRPAPNLDATNRLNLQACNLQTAPTHFLQIAEGGQSLLQVDWASIDHPQFLRSLQNICEGLQILHENDIVHMDIKPPNIVTQRQPDGTYRTRFIDVGMMFEVPQFLRMPRLERETYGQNYMFWPWETRVLSPKYVLDGPVMHRQLNHFYGEVVQKLQTLLLVPTVSYFTAEGQRLLTPRVVNDVIVPALKSLGDEERVRLVAKATDIYAMGLLFLWIESRLLPLQMRGESSLRSLIMEMMNVDPTKRPTAKAVVERMRGILATF